MKPTPEQQADLNKIYAEAYCILQTTCKKLANEVASVRLREFQKKHFDIKKH